MGIGYLVNNKKKIIILITPLVIFTLLLTEVYQFKIWSQVVDFFSEEKVVNQFDVYWFHAPRSCLVYPSYFLADLFGLGRDYVFSLEVFVLLLMTAFLGVRIIDQLIISDLRKSFFYFLYILAIFSISFFMNGRLAFAQLSFAILLVRFISRRSCVFEFFQILFATWLSSVSSGVSILFCVSLFFQLFFLHNKTEKKSIILPLLIISTYSGVAVYKVYLFYDGSFVGLFSHGYGATGLILLIFASALLLFYRKLISRLSLLRGNKLDSYLILISCSSICLSVFGKSIFWGAINIHLLTCIVLYKKFFLNSEDKVLHPR